MNITKFQLFSALAAKVGTPEAKIVIGGFEFSSIQKICREDGSGKCFNVWGYDMEGQWINGLFVRTID